jgi:hypothetical protein
VDQRGRAEASGAALVLLILAGLCAGTAVLHGMHALILLELESGLIALALAGGSALLSATARTSPRRPANGHKVDRSGR